MNEDTIARFRASGRTIILASGEVEFIRVFAISLQRGQFDPKFQVEGVPHQSFLHG